MTLKRAYNSLRKRFKRARGKLNSLMNEFGQHMDCSWILNMSINRQVELEVGVWRKNLRIDEMKYKKFPERNKTLKTKLLQKEPQSKTAKKNQSRPIICHLLNYKDKGNILKYCRKLKGTKIFVNKDLSQLTLEHRR